MYYTNGNYEAFARPRKPQGVGEKQAWLVGGGLASLAAAAFLVRDAQMDGSRIHILEDSGLPGGACDGLLRPDVGFVIRGGREMENHYECLWDLFRSVPSLEVEDASVLDEFYWLNHDDPNYSKNRATLKQGASADTKNRFELSDEAALELMRLFFTPDEALYLLDGRRLTEMKLPLPYKMALHAGLEKLRGTTLDELLVRYELV